MEIKRGDIFLTNFEQVKGAEQGRIRPALVIQNDLSNKFSPITIAIPITSKNYEKIYPTNVLIKREESGLKNDSTILTNQIRTIDKRRLIKKLGILDSFIMKKVDMALKISLGLD
jgi:mRNA interferase MazF